LCLSMQVDQTDGRGSRTGSRAAEGHGPGGSLAITMVTALFPPSIGGIQSHTLRLAQKLVAKGAAVTVVTRLGPGLATYEEMEGVAVHRVGLAGRVPPAAGSIAFIAAAAAEIVRLAPRTDVVHAHQLLSPTTASLLAAALARRPLVLNPHACGDIGDVGQLSRSAIGRARLRAAVLVADAFVAVSRPIRDELLGAGVAPRQVWSIANGVDADRFRPAGAEERASLRRSLRLPSGPLAVYAGRLAREKGGDVLLDAVPTLRARLPGARVCLVGTGAEEASLRAQASRLGIADAVVFAGGVADVAPYLRAADAAVLPSRTEGMPVALLEGMACALPCVATAVGGTREVLVDGETGWLIPAERPAVLGAALADALCGGATAATRGEAARAHVLAHYTLDAVADRFLALYRALVAQRGRGAVPTATSTVAR
jgi:glycosyltransferase involved in cell wall biosynthesis